MEEQKKDLEIKLRPTDYYHEKWETMSNREDAFWHKENEFYWQKEAILKEIETQKSLNKIYKFLNIAFMFVNIILCAYLVLLAIINYK